MPPAVAERNVDAEIRSIGRSGCELEHFDVVILRVVVGDVQVVALVDGKAGRERTERNGFRRRLLTLGVLQDVSIEAAVEIGHVHRSVGTRDDVFRRARSGERLRKFRLALRVFGYRTGSEVANVERAFRIDERAVRRRDAIGDLPYRLRARRFLCREDRYSIIELIRNVQQAFSRFCFGRKPAGCANSGVMRRPCAEHAILR